MNIDALSFSKSKKQSTFTTLPLNSTKTKFNRQISINSQKEEDQKFKVQCSQFNKKQNQTQIKNFKNQKCAVCLGNFSQDYALLKCGHIFCFDCAKQWWKQQSYCPYCRVQIEYLQRKNGQRLFIDDLSQAEQVDDDNFIPQCQACWGDVEETEQFMICSICSSIYVHQRCLSFRCRKWQCYQCSMIEDNLQMSLPIIPYQKVFHYLSLHLDKNHRQFQTRRIDNS